METKWVLIGRGMAGWFATSPKVRSTGGQLRPYMYSGTEHQQPGYAAEAAEGCLVYDASGADMTAYTEHVIHGPIFAAELEPDGWSKFGHDREGDDYGAFDYVGINRYERLLRQVPGVKFGRVRDGKVVWEEVKQPA